MSDSKGPREIDPYGGRQPTNHERQSGQPWDASYHDGPAPWEIGGPQPAIVRAVSLGALAGSVLDAGCGSGENALYLASLGFTVVGFDVAETALTRAREKAEDRKLAATFVFADALELKLLGRTFTAAIDCGLFHSFEGDERTRYARSLASVIGPGATLYVLCFSDAGPDTGPHPIRERDLRTAFDASTGWRVATIAPERVMTRFHGADGAPAWLATIDRTA